MAIQTVSLFFRRNRQYSFGNIVLDLITDETHNFNNAVTQYNVEDGSVISDHIRNELFTGSITGIITNFSLYTGELVSNRAQDAFDALEQLWRDRELITVNTVLKIYNNVAITGLSVNKSVDSGEMIAINISFIEFNVVNLQEIELVASVKLKDLKSKQNRQTSPKTQVGKTRPVVREETFIRGAYAIR